MGQDIFVGVLFVLIFIAGLVACWVEYGKSDEQKNQSEDTVEIKKHEEDNK